MEKAKGLLTKLRHLLTQNTDIRSLQERLEALDQLPIDPNGHIFPDHWSANRFKERLLNLGYLFVEGTRDGNPYIRPQTQEEYETGTLYLDKRMNMPDAAKVFDRISQQADQHLLPADMPLYRDPKKIPTAK